MRRVLFVDDDQGILDGLRRMLRPLRHEWQMTFVLGGEAGLAALAAEPFDVVVSDMRMPAMSGLQFLECVRERFPAVVRIILSGYTEAEAAERAVPIAHQFLSKPADADKIRDVVGRACKLQALMPDEGMRRTLGAIDSLPTAPRVYTALSRALADPEVSPADVAAIVEQDVVMSGKVLQLMNSAFFGLPRRATNIRQAVTFLGTSTLRNLVMTVEVFHAFAGVPGLEGFTPEAEQDHALLTGRIAMQLTRDSQLADEAFTVAILHDLGKLILARYFSEYLSEVLRICREEEAPMFVVEQRLRGVTHAEIGAYLLDLWGLPAAIVDAVAQHHTPERAHRQGLDLPLAVHLADWLACGGPQAGETGGPRRRASVDLDYLRSVGLAEALPRWSELAAAQPSGEAR